MLRLRLARLCQGSWVWLGGGEGEGEAGRCFSLGRTQGEGGKREVLLLHSERRGTGKRTVNERDESEPQQTTAPLCDHSSTQYDTSAPAPPVLELYSRRR